MSTIIVSIPLRGIEQATEGLSKYMDRIIWLRVWGEHLQ